MLHDIAHYTKLLHAMPNVTSPTISPPPNKKPTPPKFNMEPENDGFQKEPPFPIFPRDIQVPCWISGVYPPQKNSIPLFPNLPKVPTQEWATWRGQSIDAEDQQRRVRFVSSLRGVAETTFFGAVEICGRNWPTGFREGVESPSPWVLLKLFGGNLCLQRFPWTFSFLK